MSADLLVLGCGFAGSAIARRGCAAGLHVMATVRSQASADALRGQAFDLLVIPALDAQIAALVSARTHVVVAFPPDGVSDQRVAPALAQARAITYLSSTGVYGGQRGVIDDRTPLPATASERGARILHAEACYRAFGATVLRCPGIYGPSRGLHLRILRGEHRIPGPGLGTLSRIHVEDLASLVLAAAATRAETFVVGNLAPAPQIEVVRFVCESYGVAMPPSVPLAEVHESLRADRAIEPTRALSTLGVRLRYPSYREGMAPDATQIAAQASAGG